MLVTIRRAPNRTDCVLKLFSEVHYSLTVTLFVLTWISDVDNLNCVVSQHRGKKVSPCQ